MSGEGSAARLRRHSLTEGDSSAELARHFAPSEGERGGHSKRTGGERASLLEFTTVTVAAPLHRSTLTVGEREGKRWRLALVESLPSRRLAGHPPSHTLFVDVEGVKARRGFTGLPSPPPSPARSKRREGSPLPSLHSDRRNRVAAPTAVNHNRHHGWRGGFAGGHRCRVRCCGVAHYS
nr:hypothetical protein Itr_chr14CG08640 [Ipomoea trifida]